MCVETGSACFGSGQRQRVKVSTTHMHEGAIMFAGDFVLLFVQSRSHSPPILSRGMVERISALKDVVDLTIACQLPE